MVATSDLGSDAERRGGSSPFVRTGIRSAEKADLVSYGATRPDRLFVMACNFLVGEGAGGDFAVLHEAVTPSQLGRYHSPDTSS